MGKAPKNGGMTAINPIYVNDEDDSRKAYEHRFTSLIEQQYQPMMDRDTAWELACKDFKQLKHTLRHVSNGKSAPSWGIPSEIHRQIINPARTYRLAPQVGIGHQESHWKKGIRTVPTNQDGSAQCTLTEPPNTTHWLRKCLFIMRLTHRLPIQASQSDACELIKKLSPHWNLDTVGQDCRQIYLYDAQAKAIIKMLKKDAQLEDNPPHHAYGALPVRRREGAILVQEVTAELSHVTHSSSVLRLFDVTNAFNCPQHVDILRPCQLDEKTTFTLPHQGRITANQGLLGQQVVQHNTVVKCTDGALMVKLAAGTGQGSTSATSQFNLCYWPCVEHFQQEMDKKDCNVHALHPITYENIDCSITTFVDDAARRAITTNDAPWGNEIFTNSLIQAEEHFSGALQLSSLTANASKAGALVSLYGPNTINASRKLQKQLNSNVTERYLGAYMFRGGGAHREINKRTKKATSNYWVARKIWHKPTASWKVKIALFQCLVQAALLSGLLGFVLTENDYHKLQKTLVKFGRKVLMGTACAKQWKTRQDEDDTIKYKSCNNHTVLRRLGLIPPH